MIIKDITKLTEPAKPFEFLTETGVDKTVVEDSITKIITELSNNKDVNALSGPQIGIQSRIFGIKFDDTIKVFINPIITKKTNYIIAPEICASMPNKEILIARPDEITAIYYNNELKYEENKFLGAAARIFDQQCQLLDGIVPSELGLVSDVTEDGSFADMTDEELQKAQEMYVKFVQIKSKAFSAAVAEETEATSDLYKKLRFTEDVINGRTQIVENTPKLNREARRALAKKKRGK